MKTSAVLKGDGLRPAQPPSSSSLRCVSAPDVSCESPSFLSADIPPELLFFWLWLKTTGIPKWLARSVSGNMGYPKPAEPAPPIASFCATAFWLCLRLWALDLCSFWCLWAPQGPSAGLGARKRLELCGFVLKETGCFEAGHAKMLVFIARPVQNGSGFRVALHIQNHLLSKVIVVSLKRRSFECSLGEHVTLPVCACVEIYIYVYIYFCTCIRVYIYICIYSHTYVCLCVFVSMYLHNISSYCSQRGQIIYAWGFTCRIRLPYVTCVLRPFPRIEHLLDPGQATRTALRQPEKCEPRGRPARRPCAARRTRAAAWTPDMAMGQNQKPAPPVNIRFNPTTKTGSKMGGAPKTPKWDPIGFDPQPHAD